METFIKKYEHLALPLLRIIASILMMHHGWGKLLKLMAGGEIQFYDFMGLGPNISLLLAVIGEFIAPIFIILGFKTRYAAMPIVFTMAIAFFVVHAADPFGEKEMAFLYFIMFFVIMLAGPGGYSLDEKK